MFTRLAIALEVMMDMKGMPADSRVRDDAMGPYFGAAQRNRLQSLGLARWRRVLRRAGVEFFRLAADLMAILSGVRSLFARPSGRSREGGRPRPNFPDDACAPLSKHRADSSHALAHGTGGRGSRWRGPHLARRGHTRDRCDHNAADHGLHLAPRALPAFSG
jgi:hypothetical protein